MIPMLMSIQYMRYLVLREVGLKEGKHNCRVGWVNKYKFILGSSLHHIGVVVLEERYSNNFVYFFECIHDMYDILVMMIEAHNAYINHSAHRLRAHYIISDPFKGIEEMYINLVAHRKYSYLLCICPTLATYRGYSCHK